jgi:hypothetical protein
MFQDQGIEQILFKIANDKLIRKPMRNKNKA